MKEKARDERGKTPEGLSGTEVNIRAGPKCAEIQQFITVRG